MQHDDSANDSGSSSVVITRQIALRPQHGRLAAVLWACYLGSSWTWMIGMLLPALLVRDYGLWGWVVFAVPNVLGAAAMGFVLSRPDQSRAIAQRHRRALRLFTDVTIAYHLFVWGWVLMRLEPNAGYMLLLLLPLWVLFMRVPAAVTWIGGLVWLTSLICMAYASTLTESWSSLSWSMQDARFETADLLLLMPACILGFALCPYLDATFHHARQSTQANTGKTAFALGFGVVFLSMIVFSLGYAAVLLPFLQGESAATVPAIWHRVLLIHLAVQSLFTLAIHMRQRAMLTRRWLGVIWWALGGAMGLLLMSEDQWLDGLGLGLGEVLYRGFLLMYAMVFPAYVWLCMLPGVGQLRAMCRGRGDKGDDAEPLRVVWLGHRQIVWAVTCVACLPMAAMAFIAGQMWWIIPQLVLLVIAKLVNEKLPTSPQRAPGPKTPETVSH